MLTRSRGLLATSFMAIAVLALASCGNSNDALGSGSGSGSGSNNGALVVGSANFPESVLLMEIYAGALNAAGVQATTKPNIGSRETYLPALKDGSIDVFPEYTGVLRDYFAQRSGTQVSATDSQGVFAELKSVLPDYLKVLPYSSAQDKDSVTVTRATADKYSLKSIGDLAPVAGDLTLGGPPEWKTRQTGVPGLQKLYGVDFGSFQVTDAGGPITLNALLDGRIDAGNLFTTDPNIAAKDLVVLQDPKSLFAAQNIVPVLRTDADSAKVEAVLGKVSKALDTTTLGDLVSRVVIKKEDPQQVAQSFLQDANLA